MNITANGGVEGKIMMSQKEKLIELLSEHHSGNYDEALKIVDYLLNHGVIVLPCKVGDTVYFMGVKTGKVRSFYHCENPECGNLWVTVDIHRGKAVNFSAQEIGRKVFSTREEAEAALKRRADDD